MPTRSILINNNIREQEFPQIAHLNNGKIAIAWVDGISSGKDKIFGVYMQIYDTNIVNNIDDSKDIMPIMINNVGNYPNPFNPSTTIDFTLKQSALTTIDIYNIRGQKVRSLFKDQLEAGRNAISWNGENDSLQSVGSGLYFYKITVGEESVKRKMLLMK